MRKLFLLFAFAAALAAAQTHSATIVVTDANNPTGTTYNIYRAASACPTSGTLPLPGPAIATGIQVKTYTDSTIAVGTYCYTATAVVSGAESAQSNDAGTAVLPFSVTVTVTSK